MTSSINAVHIPNVAFHGLARERQQVALEPEWCTKAENIIIDGAGRLAARKGWAAQNGTPISGTPTINQIHEYVKTDGTTEIISASADDLFTGASTPTSIVGALTPTAGNWQFVNFNGNVYGWQASHTPIVYTGTGDFTAMSASTGTLPDGNTVLAAYGRLWAVDDDGQTIRYCALLDPTLWAVADGGGVIDMRSVWTRGTDTVQRIVAYGSSLIVFGKRHVVIWVDGSGSDIGIDPVNIYVGQVIENVGLVSRDAMALAGEIDVLFWSYNGVRSLRRTLQETATPVNEISPQNRDFLSDSLSTGDLSKVRGVYSAINGYFLLSHPDDSRTFCFDSKGLMQDGALRMTTWTLVPTAACETISGDVYFGFPSTGVIGKYSGYLDNTATYRFDYESGWMALEPAMRLKMLKRLKAFLFSPASGQVTFKWWTDFKSNLKTYAKDLVGDGDEWNVDEWSLMEWSAGKAQHEKYVPLSNSCQYVKVGVLFVVNGRPFGVQNISLYYEPTRLV